LQAQKRHEPIRIQNERNIFHLPIAESFLKRNAKPLKPLAGSLDIIDADRDVPEASTRIGVAARVALEVGVRFSSAVVCQFKDAWIGVSKRGYGVGRLLAFAREAGMFFLFCGEIFTIVVECEEV